ncbi:Uncharacterised protein [Citrobacter koseri]|nr:Uncharacterised protein [Citrobacter koseri]
MGVDFATIPDDDRNCIYLYLTNETWRSRIENRDVLPTFVSYFPCGNGGTPWRSGVGK